MVSLLQRGSAKLRLHTIAQYFCVHCNGWLWDTYASWWFRSNFLSILKPQSRWSIVVPRNFNMFDKTLMPDVVKPSMDATVHFLVSECLLERKIMWTPSKPSLSSLVISAKLYPIYLPAFDPVLRAALHFLDSHHFPFPHPLFWHMLDANSMPQTAIPRLRRQESIISGASIFYGSVSNAVIGEAIAAGDQGQRNESTSRLISDEVDNDLSWPFFLCWSMKVTLKTGEEAYSANSLWSPSGLWILWSSVRFRKLKWFFSASCSNMRATCNSAKV